jgi:hypothetical protein
MPIRWLSGPAPIQTYEEPWMTRDIVTSVQTVLAERRIIAKKEKRLINRLSGLGILSPGPR